MVSKSS